MDIYIINTTIYFLCALLSLVFFLVFLLVMKNLFFCISFALLFVFCVDFYLSEKSVYHLRGEFVHKEEIIHDKLSEDKLYQNNIDLKNNGGDVDGVHLEGFDDILFVKSICQQTVEVGENSERIVNDYLKLCDSAVLMDGEYIDTESDDYIIAKYNQSRKGTEEYTSLAFKYASLDRAFIDSLVGDLSVLTLNRKQLEFLCEYAAGNNNYEPRCQLEAVSFLNEKNDIVREYLACENKECRENIINVLK